jgi:integrase
MAMGGIGRSLLPVLGHRSLQSITPTDVRALVRLVRERLAPRTAWHIHGLLATILRAAVGDGWLASSPCRRPAPPRPRRVPVTPLSVG